MKVGRILIVTFLLALIIACGRPDDLDLSETYFPMGLNYEWTYERCDWGSKWHDWGDWVEEESWSYYDTFTIKVTDSSLITRGWEFELNGGEFRDVGPTPEIVGSRIKVFYDEKKVDIVPEEEEREYGRIGLEVKYSEDTLILTWVKEIDERNERYGILEETKRIKSIGVLFQRYYDWYWGNVAEAYEGIYDRLLWFVKDGDTIWNHEDTIRTILF